MATTENLYENDLRQSMMQYLPEKLVSLGRVRLEECQSRAQEVKPTPTKMHQNYRKADPPVRASANNIRKEKEITHIKGGHAGSLPVNKVVEKAGHHKGSSQMTTGGNVNKRKTQVIDSDDEGEVDDSVHDDKKFKTYINDNGEEVTG